MPDSTLPTKVLISESKVFEYELDMFYDLWEAWIAWLRFKNVESELFPPDLKAVIRNALIESFALHTRNIIDFLYGSRKKKRDRDLFGSDFFDGSNEVSTVNWEMLEREDKIHELWKTVSKTVLHMTEKRLDIEYEDKFEISHVVFDNLEPAIQSFLAAVPDVSVIEELLQYRESGPGDAEPDVL